MIVYREVSTLAHDLGVDAHTLYAVSNHLPAHYHRAEVPKRGGGVRELTVPDAVLKNIQRRIAGRLLAYMPVSPYATAYRYGASVVKNAARHVGREAVLKLDVRHFFDSVRYSMVKERAFPAQIYAEPLRVLLSILCYYRDALPQGAPSSPAVANLVLRDFDDRVGRWCGARGIAYSRYCDDLTFSGAGGLDEARALAQGLLEEEGFSLQERKTTLRRCGQRQTVTGLVVNDRVNVPAQYRRALRQEVYYCRKFGVEAHVRRTGGRDPAEAYLQRLLGRVSFWMQADPGDREAAEYKDWILEQLRARRAEPPKE